MIYKVNGDNLLIKRDATEMASRIKSENNGKNIVVLLSNGFTYDKYDNYFYHTVVPIVIQTIKSSTRVLLDQFQVESMFSSLYGKISAGNICVDKRFFQMSEPEKIQVLSSIQCYLLQIDSTAWMPKID